LCSFVLASLFFVDPVFNVVSFLVAGISVQSKANHALSETLASLSLRDVNGKRCVIVVYDGSNSLAFFGFASVDFVNLNILVSFRQRGCCHRHRRHRRHV
jgi:hypothetical protein